MNRSEQFTRLEVKNYLLALLVFVILQLSAIAGQSLSAHFNLQSAVAEIKQRIGLDTPHLDLGNSALNTVINESAVVYYINQINEELEQIDAPVRVKTIQGVSSVKSNFPAFTQRSEQVLLTTDQQINVEVVHLPTYTSWGFSWFSLAVAVAVLFIPQSKLEELISSGSGVKSDIELKLVIDLQKKTLSSSVSDLSIPLQNKPLCFYAALVRYCISHPEKTLHLHQDIPEELVQLANRVFARLIELGHSKRKRPDFNANLDKTLSEIRAALDEVFHYSPNDKTRFYPPRAQGEGSRSRQHSYALTDVKLSDIEFIGS